MTTALIIDPGLTVAHGHNYSALLRIGAELSRLGVKHTCLASVQADAVVRKHAVPVLPKKGLWWRLQETRSEFLAHVEEMGGQLSLAFGEQENPADLLVFPCCDAVQVQALAMILRRRMPLPAPHIVMWILLPEVLEECSGAFASLKEAVSDERRIAVYCETTAMAETLGNLIGLQVGVAPSANLAGVNGKGRRRAGNAAPKVICTGVGNTAKGYDLLPGALARVLRSNDDVTFWIHGVVANSNQAHNLAIFKSLSNMGRRVVTSNAVLTPEDYLAHLLQADLVLLPYDEKVYGMRGSGVFNEAREIGIPIVATRGCGFATPAFCQGWGVEIAERSPIGVAEAILEAVSRLPELTARAADAAAAKSGGDGVAMVLQKAVRTVNSQDESGGKGASRAAGWTLPVAKPLSKSLFSKIALSNGAVVRGSLPVAIRKLIPRLPGRGLSVLTDALIATSTIPYHYSVLLHVDGAVTRWLEPGSLLMVEIFVEVLAGEIGIVWVDDGGQPLQDSERYALATPGFQRVVVSIPVDRARCLVFRNVATTATAALFRVVRLNASSITEVAPRQVQVLASSDDA